MHIVAWLVVGGLIGWQGSMILLRMGQQGITVNVIAGSVGAVLFGIVSLVRRGRPR